MAEAHSAVAFSFSVTHEGLDVNFDRQVLDLVWNSGIRSWRKRIVRFRNSASNGVYPASLESLLITISIVSGLYFCHLDLSAGLIQSIQEYLPGSFLLIPSAVTSCALFGCLLWFIIIYSIRYLLRILFYYKGWMYESRGKNRSISPRTKIWAVLTKLLTGKKPMLYSYQGSLPSLPVPAVHDTMTRYLRSVRPLLNDAQYTRMENLAAEFEETIAPKLQRYLYLKSWWASNYVSDWWEEYVYLRGRSPLMVNSNFYAMDALLQHPTKRPAARAGNIIHACLLFRRAIDRQELEPIMVQGMVPLCSWQYERVFNTTRLPGLETDRTMHLDDSTHIVVLYRGCFYKMPVYYNARMLTPCEMEEQIQQILDDDRAKPVEGEEHIASLTATDRITWAKARNDFFSKGVNKQSLDIIEKAAFAVALDDEDYSYDVKDPTKLNHYARMLLHGHGCDRWFDKSFTLIIGRNARIGFNAEHSWADAAILSHMWEHVLMEDLLVHGYTEDGHCVGTVEETPPIPTRLKWDLSPKCLQLIDNCYQEAQNTLNDVDLKIFVHEAYGKGFMKTCSVSPDAFIQMALQLAYYRDAGKFNLTYEASMTRLFREGRTETVRPCTIESCAWVKAMEDTNSKVEEKIKLLRAACGVHVRGYQDAMCGKGIDRHLFCLYVISKYLEIDSPFLKEVLSEPWRLSTSQTPHGQTTKFDHKKIADCISAGGGFGPVADDGYGVSYIIAGENLVFFHISSKRSSCETDSSRFARQINRALEDIRNLFESAKKEAKK